MRNFKKVEHEHQNFLSVIPVYSVVGNFGEDKTDVLIESEVYDDTLDFFNAIYCNSFPFNTSQKGYSMDELEGVDLLVSLMGISNKDTQVVIYSSVMKSLKVIIETPTTKIRIRDKYKKKSKIIECSIRECLEKYINVDIEEKWQKYDISDWRFGLEKKTDYMEC